VSDKSAGASVTSVDDSVGWVPDEETGGLVRMLRESDGLLVGLWKPNGVAGTRIEYRLEADETLVVLQGSGEVRVDGGEPIQLRPGMVVSLRSGCDLSWFVGEDFRELWIYT
jgi:uncharacterized cupin superfamily protein